MKFLSTIPLLCSQKYLRGLVVLLLGFLPLAAQAAPDTGFISLQLENDVWASTDDRFYTHGTEISFATGEQPPAWMEKVTDAVPFYKKGKRGLHGFSIGQTIFTPEDTSQTQLIRDDRPYAGWLFLDCGIAHIGEDSGDRQLINGLVLTIGIVGPESYADKTQKEFHRFIGVDIPQGWDNQLHDELGINMAYIRKRRHLFGLDMPLQFELSYHGGLTLGNVYTYGSAGLMARWGTALQNDIGPPTISPGFPGVPAFKPDPQFNWYIFAGTEGRAMAHNIFLDGNTFRDSHSIDKKYFVGDLQLGIAMHYKNIRISYSHMMRSKEFDGQPNHEEYGAINITVFTR